jgi:ABC-type transport system involved in cytochrome c biogenesis permease subunit
MAYVSIVGFIAVLFTYWGVNYLLSGLHSYA